MNDFRDHIRRAVTIKGSQEKLADAAGCSQQHISWLLQEATRVSAEIANGIHNATNGEVHRADLRPDLYAKEKVA